LLISFRSTSFFRRKNIYFIGSRGSGTSALLGSVLFADNCPCRRYCFFIKQTFALGVGFELFCQLRVSAQDFVKLKRSEIVVPAKFGDGTGFLVLSHWFVVLSFDFIFDFSVRIWYNGFGNWSG